MRIENRTSRLNATTIETLCELDGGSGFFRDLISEYVAQAEQLFADMERAKQAHDVDALLFAFHALKGSSHNIGAQELGKLCAEYEAMHRNLAAFEAVEATDFLSTLRQAYEHAVTDLRACAADC